MSLENALARIAARVEALEADNTRLSAGQTNIFGRLEALEKWVDAVENPPDCPPSEPMTYDAPSPAVPTLATTLEGIVRWLEPKDPQLSPYEYVQTHDGPDPVPMSSRLAFRDRAATQSLSRTREKEVAARCLLIADADICDTQAVSLSSDGGVIPWVTGRPRFGHAAHAILKGEPGMIEIRVDVTGF